MQHKRPGSLRTIAGFCMCGLLFSHPAARGDEQAAKTWTAATVCVTGRAIALAGPFSPPAGTSTPPVEVAGARPAALPAGASAWLDRETIPPPLRDYAKSVDRANVFGVFYDPSLDRIGKTGATQTNAWGQTVIRVGTAGVVPQWGQPSYAPTIAHELTHAVQHHDWRVFEMGMSPALRQQLQSKDPEIFARIRGAAWEQQAQRFEQRWVSGTRAADLQWRPDTLRRWTDDLQQQFKNGTLGPSSVYRAPTFTYDDIRNRMWKPFAAGGSAERRGKAQNPARTEPLRMEGLVAEIDQLQNVVRDHPADVEHRLRLAHLLMDLRHLSPAIEQLRAAAETAPARVDIAFSLGAALASAGRHAESVEAYRKARALAPDDARVALALGFELCEMSHYEAAADTFQAFPDAAEASFRAGRHLGMAMVRQHRGDTAGAQREYALAEEALPGLGPLMTHLDMLRVWPQAIVNPQGSTHPAFDQRLQRLREKMNAPPPR